MTVRATSLSSECDSVSIELDKTDPARARAVVESDDPDLVVDTAAFHAGDDFETERDTA